MHAEKNITGTKSSSRCLQPSPDLLLPQLNPISLQPSTYPLRCIGQGSAPRKAPSWSWVISPLARAKEIKKQGTGVCDVPSGAKNREI